MSTGRGPAHRPRRRFGQHFLRDVDVAERMLGAIAPRGAEQLVEIGPGLGALTAGLLERCKRLQVIELDRDLARSLPGRLGNPAGLVVHQADALEVELGGLREPPGRLRVVGNLPYNISSPLIFHLLGQREHVSDLHFMLQNEVVERLVALPGSKAYGRLSISTQLRCQATKLFEVGPEAFEPAPRVHSAVVRLVVRSRPAVALTDEVRFDALVRAAFAQRRKTLRNALRGLVDPTQFERSGIDPGRRAETLHLVELARLSNEVSG